MKIARILGLAVAASLAAIGGAHAQNKWETIKIATEGAYAPWNFSGPGGKLDGYEVELATELCKRMSAKCEVVAQDWDGIIPALNARKYDAIMAGMNATAKRREVIAFSRSYAAGPHGWAADKSSPLAKLAGTGQKLDIEKDSDAAKKLIEEWKPLLKGKAIGVQGSTTNANFVEKFFKDVVTIREYKTTEQHDLDLAAGRIDAIYASHAAITATLEKPEFKDLQIVGAGMTGDVLGEGVAVGLRKEDADLKQKFDAAIQSAIADGTIEKLTKKWFKLDMTPQA